MQCTLHLGILPEMIPNILMNNLTLYNILKDLLKYHNPDITNFISISIVKIQLAFIEIFKILVIYLYVINTPLSILLTMKSKDAFTSPLGYQVNYQ